MQPFPSGTDPVRPSRAWALFAILIAGLGLAWILFRAHRDPALAYLARHGNTPWIVPDRDLSVRARVEPLPPAEFVHRFDVATLGAEPRISVRALREHELVVNGRTVGHGRPDDWKAAQVHPLAGVLRMGTNEILVRVSNPSGSPALWLDSADVEPPLRSGPHFLTSAEGTTRPARRAEDYTLQDESFLAPRPLDAWLELWPRMLVLASVVIALVIGLGRLAPEVRERLARPKAWIALVALGALALFLDHASRIQGGFDGGEHMSYIMAITEGRIPSIREGWQTYHPPLYHALAAASLWLTMRMDWDAGHLMAVLWLPALSGALQVVASGYLAHLLFPGRRAAWLAAGLFAACVPVNLYMSSFVSNEPLAAALAGLGLALAARSALDPARSPIPAALCFGFSLLTKMTVVLYLPLVGFAFLWAWHARGVPWAARARGLGLFYAVVLAVASYGLFRAWSQVGTPLVGNWDVERVGFFWWQDPGYVTAGYYLDFGSVLDRPFYAGAVSFWDGIYSTLWGDGLTAGLGKRSFEIVRWNWEHMAVGYWLAVPLCLLLLLGAGLGVRALFRDPRAGAWAIVVGSVAVTLLGVLYMTIRVPSYAQVKAHYGLSALVGLSTLFAAAVVWLGERGTVWRVATWSAALLFAVNSWIAFWAV